MSRLLRSLRLAGFAALSFASVATLIDLIKTPEAKALPFSPTITAAVLGGLAGISIAVFFYTFAALLRRHEATHPGRIAAAASMRVGRAA